MRASSSVEELCVPYTSVGVNWETPTLLPPGSVSFSVCCMLAGILFNDIYFSKRAPECKSISSSGTQRKEDIKGNFDSPGLLVYMLQVPKGAM